MTSGSRSGGQRTVGVGDQRRARRGFAHGLDALARARAFELELEQRAPGVAARVVRHLRRPSRRAACRPCHRPRRRQPRQRPHRRLLEPAFEVPQRAVDRAARRARPGAAPADPGDSPRARSASRARSISSSTFARPGASRSSRSRLAAPDVTLARRSRRRSSSVSRCTSPAMTKGSSSVQQLRPNLELASHLRTPLPRTG